MQKKLCVIFVCLVLMGLVGIASASIYDGNPAPIVYYKWIWNGAFPHLQKCVEVSPNLFLGAGQTPFQYSWVGAYDWTHGVCAKCTYMG